MAEPDDSDTEVKKIVKEEIRRQERGSLLGWSVVITAIFALACGFGVWYVTHYPEDAHGIGIVIKIVSGVLAVFTVFLKIFIDEKKNAIEALRKADPARRDAAVRAAEEKPEGNRSGESQGESICQGKLDHYQQTKIVPQEKRLTLVTFATGCCVILGMIFQ